jgi:hypothetical protein
MARETVITMEGVREYAEGYDVELVVAGDRTYEGDPEPGRVVIRAYNEAKHNSTWIDLEQLLSWLAAHRPDLFPKAAG